MPLFGASPPFQVFSSALHSLITTLLTFPPMRQTVSRRPLSRCRLLVHVVSSAFPVCCPHSFTYWGIMPDDGWRMRARYIII